MSWVTSALQGDHGSRILVPGKAGSLPKLLPSPTNTPGVRERRTCSLVAWWGCANCAVGWALMIIFCISHIRPHSRWDATAVTQSGSWAAIQKQPSLGSLDHSHGRTAAGTLRAGQQELWQASLAHSMNMLDGLEGG